MRKDIVFLSVKYSTFDSHVLMTPLHNSRVLGYRHLPDVFSKFDDHIILLRVSKNKSFIISLLHLEEQKAAGLLLC